MTTSALATYWLLSYLLVGWSFSKFLARRVRSGQHFTALELAYHTVILFLVAGLLAPLVAIVELDALFRKK
jgi:hypothetical protein